MTNQKKTYLKILSLLISFIFISTNIAYSAYSTIESLRVPSSSEDAGRLTEGIDAVNDSGQDDPDESYYSEINSAIESHTGNPRSLFEEKPTTPFFEALISLKDKLPEGFDVIIVDGIEKVPIDVILNSRDHACISSAQLRVLEARYKEVTPEHKAELINVILELFQHQAIHLELYNRVGKKKNLSEIAKTAEEQAPSLRARDLFNIVYEKLKQESEYYIVGSGMHKGEVKAPERLICGGSLSQVVAELKKQGHEKEAANLESVFNQLYPDWKEKYPVLEEDISGPINFEIAENMPATCETNVYANILRIDISTLLSSYLFRIELIEALDHQSRALLDGDSDREGNVAVYRRFWAFEEFCSDYEKVEMFRQDYETASQKGAKETEEIVAQQAEALEILIGDNSAFIEVIFRAISEGHRDKLLAKLAGKIPKTSIRTLEKLHTYTNQADLAFKLKDYSRETYPKLLYQYIDPLGYGNIVAEIEKTHRYYRTLRGRYGRGYYHGINKMNLRIEKAKRGEKAFFDLLVVVVEDKGEKQTENIIEGIRGEDLPRDQKVLVVTQPTIDTLMEDMVKGNWSAVIRFFIERVPDYKDYEGIGSVAVLLSAGTGTRNAGITQTGHGDKGKAACVNGLPYIQQVIRQAYQYWDKDLNGVLVLSNDGIEAISNVLTFGEHPISVLGSTLRLDDSRLDDLGTMLIDSTTETHAKDIVRLVEKAKYAGRRKVFGQDDSVEVPYSMAKYFFRWDAVSRTREIFDPLKDDEGRPLYIRYGLDQAGESIEAVTGRTEKEYVDSKIAKGWDARDARRIYRANAILMAELGGKYGFIDTGAFFVDTGDNAAYRQFTRNLTIKVEKGMSAKEKELALTMEAARALLGLPEPDEENRVIKVGVIYLDGKEVTGEELIKDEDLMRKIEDHVVLVARFGAIGKIDHAIDAGNVVINPLIYELGPSEDNGFLFFVEEAGVIIGRANNLICDIDTKDGKIRICMPLDVNAKDKAGMWDVIGTITGTSKGSVFITKERVVDVVGVSDALREAKLNRDKEDGTKGVIVDSEGNELEKVALVQEEDLWDLKIWPRSSQREGRPISFREQRKGAHSFDDLNRILDNARIEERYTEEYWRAFVRNVEMRRSLEHRIEGILREVAPLKERLIRMREALEELVPESAFIPCLNAIIEEKHFRLSEGRKLLGALNRRGPPFNGLNDNELSLLMTWWRRFVAAPEKGLRDHLEGRKTHANNI